MSTDSPPSEGADDAPGCLLPAFAAVAGLGLLAKALAEVLSLTTGIAVFAVGLLGIAALLSRHTGRPRRLANFPDTLRYAVRSGLDRLRHAFFRVPETLPDAELEGGFSNWSRICDELGLERRDNYPSTPLRAAGRVRARSVEIFEQSEGSLGHHTRIRIDCNDVFPEELVFRPKSKSVDLEDVTERPVDRRVPAPPHDHYVLEAFGELDLQSWSEPPSRIEKMVHLCETPESGAHGSHIHRGIIANAYLSFTVSGRLQDLDDAEVGALLEVVKADLEQLDRLHASLSQ